MEQTTPLHVTNHFRNHQEEYQEIDTRLDKTRETFLSADRSEQIRMLQKSHSFAVISVQTPVHIHEQAFTQLWENDTPVQDLESALESVNYKNNKADYIRHSINNAHMWADVTDMLENGNIDKAHKFVLDNMKGVGPAKAPFTLAMLGFKQKACIDANIVDVMGLEQHVSTVVVEKYDQIVEDFRNEMPTLKEVTSPFLWQWVVFDWNRGEISKHKTFYKIVGTF